MQIGTSSTAVDPTLFGIARIFISWKAASFAFDTAMEIVSCHLNYSVSEYLPLIPEQPIVTNQTCS
jgi:hypothetical protein